MLALAPIAYDVDHEIVWIEVIDPLSVEGDLPVRVEQTDEELFQQCIRDVTESCGQKFTEEDLLEARKLFDESNARISELASPEVTAALEKSFKQKMLLELKEKFLIEEQLLTSEPK